MGCELLRAQGFPSTFKSSGSTCKEMDVQIPVSCSLLFVEELNLN